VSRSLILAFMIAIIIHGSLAVVRFDFLKRPLRLRNSSEGITMDLIEPREKKKPSKPEKPPVAIKKREKDRIKTSVAKKVEQVEKPETKPTIKKDRKEIQREPLMAVKEASQKIEAPVYQPPPAVFPDKEEIKDSKHEYALVPDEADIPTVLQKEDDLPHSGEKDRPAPASVEKVRASENEYASMPDPVDGPMVPHEKEDSPDTGENNRSTPDLHDEQIIYATPNYKKNPPPSYPLSARRRNYEGTVLLDVLVKREGTVDSIRLAQSSGYDILDRAAIKAVMNWAFHPGKRGDEPLDMWVTVPIRFQLK
jgi:periplasmic protein TonB